MVIIVPQQTVKEIVQSWANYQMGSTGFVAPTFYLKSGVSLPRLNYYATKEAAFKQLLFMTNSPGGVDQKTVAGSITFKNDGSAQTAGINCDFFVPIAADQLIPADYAAAKAVYEKVPNIYFIVRFYKTDGTGAYYSILTPIFFGIAATVVKATGDKLAAMKEFYKNLEFVKAEYNALVGTLNELTNQPFNPITQQTINRLTQRRITMLSEIKSISGINLMTSSGGTINGIGIIPIAIIVAIAIIGAAAWGVTTWIKENEKSKRILSAYQHQQYMAAEQQKILDACKSGAYSQDQCNTALKNIGIAIETGKDVANKSAENTKGLFGEIGDMVKWGAVGFIAYMLIKRA